MGSSFYQESEGSGRTGRTEKRRLRLGVGGLLPFGVPRHSFEGRGVNQHGAGTDDGRTEKAGTMRGIVVCVPLGEVRTGFVVSAEIYGRSAQNSRI